MTLLTSSKSPFRGGGDSSQNPPSGGWGASFPFLKDSVYGRRLVYLDSAATSQRPQCVIDAMAEAYAHANANVHRGVHYLSGVATEHHEAAREHVRSFLNARSTAEIIFTRGTTESINLVAASYGEAFLKKGDEILVSEMEHHSNIVPWQLLAARKGVVVKKIPITDAGEIDLAAYKALFTPRTRLVCVAHISNVLGTVNDVAQMADIAHAHDAHILVDGAQSVAHRPVDVQALHCDFFAFSAHKIYGPTGLGVLYGREELLEKMPPYQGGGEMIDHVSFDHTTFDRLPFKFEAGTPHFIGTHALDVALSYVESIGFAEIMRHESDLTSYALNRLQKVEGLRVYGNARERDAVVSFTIEGIHPLDLGTLLDHLGIAIRTGHHCAEPLMHRYGVESMARASFALYSTEEDVDALVEGIQRVRKMF